MRNVEDVLYYRIKNQMKERKHRNFCHICFCDNDCNIPSKQPLYTLFDGESTHLCAIHGIQELEVVKENVIKEQKELSKKLNHINGLIDKLKKIKEIEF